MKLLVGQSGGPTTAINASLAGVISTCVEREIEIYGMLHGIEGALKEDFVRLNSIAPKLDSLKQTPAMYLGSCRYKIEESEFDHLSVIFMKHNFTHIVYIGGNDSMDTVAKLSKYFKLNNIPINIIGIPKTVDNDLALTDHTPGYGSAARYLYHTLSDIYFDTKIYDVPTVVIVEIMGRNAGWLTLATSLPRVLGKTYPHVIAFPEVPFNEDKFIDEIIELQKSHKTVICAVSEGIKNENGEYLVAAHAPNDKFAHKSLGGVSKYLQNLVIEKTGIKCRGIELSILQRTNTYTSSKKDLNEAFKIDEAGANACLDGETGKVMIYKRVSNTPYRIEILSADVNEIANVEKKLPPNFIDYENNLESIGEYLLPLVSGDLHIVKDDNSLVEYLDVRDLIKKHQENLKN